LREPSIPPRELINAPQGAGVAFFLVDGALAVSQRHLARRRKQDLHGGPHLVRILRAVVWLLRLRLDGANGRSHRLGRHGCFFGGRNDGLFDPRRVGVCRRGDGIGVQVVITVTCIGGQGGFDGREYRIGLGQRGIDHRPLGVLSSIHGQIVAVHAD